MHEHSRDHEHSHDHEHDEAVGPLEDNPIWQQDNVTLHSVGIDIGSSGTQVVFSRLHLRRIGEELTSRYIVVRRETLHRSPVELTPYRNAELINVGALGTMVDRAYQAAGMSPEQVDTGVVILTGEALRRSNAEAIATVLAEKAGDLVTATAGHHMEAMLAAYGSGAAKASYDSGLRLLNIDIGGGTTKLAVVDRGRVEATAAVHVGGRLQVVDEDDRIVRLDPAGRRHAQRAGYDWKLGDVAKPDEVETVAEGMADALVTLVVAAAAAAAAAAGTGERKLGDLADLCLTARLPEGALDGVDGVMFSGGVGEYVYDGERRSFGDLGKPLGRALRKRVDEGALPFRLLPAGERIRATALGASEYSVQLSGNTCFITKPEKLLPRRNVQVVRPRYQLSAGAGAGLDVDPRAIAMAIRAHLTALDADANQDADVALALAWSGPPSHARLHAFATGVRDGLADRIATGAPVYLMLDGDVALTLGRLLRDELEVSNEMLVIDGLSLRDFDYIDLGRLRRPSLTVPVTIKSLVFHEGGVG
ncbi:MAG TPA: ethanolamine ammonia-lyase reactivating factor EutA [Actinospica sp.]|nr:ethanolamine ammonia-lyase reactivating factor EutA [Actinospica sp.]